MVRWRPTVIARTLGLALRAGLCGLALAAGCAAPAGVRSVSGAGELRPWFDAHDGEPRALLLLSPT